MNTKKSESKPETVANKRASGGRVTRIVRPLPCPFCGKKPAKSNLESGGGSLIATLTCKNKNCVVRPSVGVFKTGEMTDVDARNEVVVKWNCRPESSMRSKNRLIGTVIVGLRCKFTESEMVGETDADVFLADLIADLPVKAEMGDGIKLRVVKTGIGGANSLPRFYG